MRSVLVTGANRGIGLEFVRQLLQLEEPPLYVFACCRAPEDAEALQSLTKDKQQLKIIKLDVTDEATFPEAVATVDRAVGEEGLGVLINNAGVLQRGGTETTSMADMEESYRVNVMGPLAVSQAFLPALKRAANRACTDSPKQLSTDRAAIVNITSALGSFQLCTSSRYIPYRTTKAALHMLTKCMNFDLRPQGILVVALHTGWVQTDMGGKNASLTPKKSIQGMLRVLARLREKDAGKAFTWEGKLLPW
ncbi:C-factor-like [Patiria miniata]|uniref:C-factor n=1 Tax=Patiria miniata TaxID=46514 RepID=A0A913ZRH6_PATMI|nr:C-factor-like [Patiria miniata]